MNLLLALTGVQSAQGAAVVSSNVFSFADCDPSNTSTGQPPSGSASCSNSDATAEALTTFTSAKAKSQVSLTGPDGRYGASNLIDDSVLINPSDASFNGQTGTLQFSIDVDGTLLGRSQMFVEMYEYVRNPGLGSVSRIRQPTSFTADILLSDGTATSFSSPPDQDRFTYGVQPELLDPSQRGVQNLTVSLLIDFDIVFGETLTYGLGQAITTFEPVSSVDFFNTTSFGSVTAFDSLGNIVATDLMTAGGIDLNNLSVNQPPTTDVPEPATLATFGLGLAAVGFATRRRRLVKCLRV